MAPGVEAPATVAPCVSYGPLPGKTYKMEVDLQLDSRMRFPGRDLATFALAGVSPLLVQNNESASSSGGKTELAAPEFKGSTLAGLKHTAIPPRHLPEAEGLMGGSRMEDIASIILTSAAGN